MKIHKSVHTNFVLYSPVIIIGIWFLYRALSEEFYGYWFSAGFILILFFQFCHHQYNLHKHSISIEGADLHIISNNHEIKISLEDIKEVKLDSNVLSLTCSKVTYTFNLAMFNTYKVDDFVKELKTLTSR